MNKLFEGESVRCIYGNFPYFADSLAAEVDKLQKANENGLIECL